jgi:hypothetical protein
VEAGWLFVAEVEVSIMGLAEDECRVTLRRGGEDDVLRLRHSFVNQLDRDIPVPACPGSDEEAALAALEHAASTGWLTIREATHPGLLTIDQVQEAVGRGHRRWRAERDTITRESWELERAAPSRIVQTATELRLGPEPTGGKVGNWLARCPGTNHTIMISSRREEFGCGYCKVKGGPEELRHVAGRRRSR